ncbi:thiamine pyrophosphate-binding protein [Paracoccus sp. R12_1]|uniref:thiamine pyrophosphate-binding protein n=1 Tax=unclassified Paracoccus (in: a-proteobacteria) TaxID=2688777 RepID=UPI001ADD1269|nr:MULTISPECIES: thiamine pyrophosphate-binding protein [unclassified Paracoccus (in: a-proteobacteria)]MBO9456998.1 thiamine pyrophosphate-binding protein [Paracoccus sp. R12_2]MBO9488117.1 thiamine pyrophosphate-binding protein [Paracoccus sp. R12_1]
MTRNGGQLLVESLVALGAVKCFGIPGESYLAVLDALHDTQGRLDYILCRNEGGAAFMAAAYGKLTGQPGICFVTRGPGVTNASIGIHTAMQDSAPMLVFVGQVGTDMKGREAFQEIDYRAVFGTMAKWAVEIDDVDRIPEILSRAWTQATTGRPGPVVVALPEDMLTSLTDTAPLSGPIEITEPAPTPATMARIRDMLAGAVRPLIVIGGCNWKNGSTRAIQEFAEASDIPVAAIFRYQDQFDNNSPVFIGEMGVGMTPKIRGMVGKADVILAINNRFGEMSTDGYTLLEVPQPKQAVIHVHGSDLEIGKVYRPALGVHAGPNAFAEALSAVEPVKGGWAEWRADARAAYEAGFELPDLPSPVDMGKVCAYLRDRLPEDFVLTNGAGNFTVWPGKFFRYGPKARLLGPQSGAMGYGVPAAIAAKVACPERTVVCFAGDGDFQMNNTELATALQHDAQPIILVLNNGIYGTIRAHQERNYPARVSGTTMVKNPDFVTFGKAYGFHAERVETTADFAAAFERAMASNTGALLELNISPEALTPRQTLTQMRDAALAAKENA